jgi:hypothetical protein
MRALAVTGRFSSAGYSTHLLSTACGTSAKAGTRTENLMAFKSVDEILKPDIRFENLCVVENGVARFMELPDYHGAIANVILAGVAPKKSVMRSIAPATHSSTPTSATTS